jgi:hypothetical protein
VKRIGDDVGRELRRFGPAGTMPRIVEVWRDAVGPTIARNAWPARVARDGTLHVHTSSSAWAFELGQLRDDILGRLREAAGPAAPRALRFAVGRLPEPGPEEEARALPKLTTEHLTEGARLAAGIEDEELRETVARAAARALARAADDRTF